MIDGMIRRFGQEVTVKEKATAQNGAYQTETWSTKFQTVGVLDTIRGTKNARYDQVNEQSTHFLYLNPCDITIEDRIIIDSNTYNVLFVHNPMGIRKFLQVEMELVPYGV